MASPYWNEIDNYWYFWHVEKPGGRLFLKLSDGSTLHVDIGEDVRFQGIVDTLRNEKPCSWNATYTLIGPGTWEEVGEEET